MTTVAFFDVDGTLTKVHVWQAFMAYFKTHGRRLWVHRFYWLWHMAQYPFFKMGWMSETAFRRKWAGHLAWYVRGMSVDEAQAIWEWVVKEYLPPHWRASSVARLQAHLQKGDVVVLVSAAPEPLIQRVAHHLGTPHAVATRLEVRDGRYTGRAVPPVCIGPAKPQRAFEYLQAQGIVVAPEASWAYADAISDLELLTSVGHPVAVAPEPDLASLARERGWEILPE